MAAQPNESGRHSVVFSVHGADRDRPVTLPCGKCVGCVQDKAEAWSVRCFHESQLHERNCFVTLTYRDPAPEKLCKHDLQTFFKRLRKTGVRFRYFAVGEYGERTHRPHYHVLLFGQDFREGSFRVGMGPRSDNEYYVNSMISGVWGNGHVTIAPCEAGSIFYTCGYSLKNLGDPECFHMQSKRPYLGAGWLGRFHDDCVRNGFVTIDGVKHAVPASYVRRPELELEMDELRSRKAEAVRTLDPEIRWQRRVTASARETNLKAAAAARRGDL